MSKQACLPDRQVQVDENSPMLGEHTLVLFYLVGAITSWKLALAIFMAKKKLMNDHQLF
jgi:hypothetical protein